MKKIFTQLLPSLILGFFTPLASFAWNAEGHMVVAKIAYNNLDPTVRTKVDKMVSDLAQEYPSIHSFVDLAPWPDQLVAQQVGLFSHWHYIDNEYSDDGTPIKTVYPADNVVWAIGQLAPIVKNEQANPYERARALAFLIHFVGDVHQPLHNIDRISAAHPDGDQGGNLYFITGITNKIKSRAGANLHFFWDSGLGIFESNANVNSAEALANTISAAYPATYFNQLATNLNQTQWSNEGYALASFVYSTPENQTPNEAYVAKGQEIVKQRMALAGYRLAAELNSLLGQSKTKA